MKRTMIASAIALAFGFTTPAMANPTNTLEDRNEDISQTATAQSTLDGKGASANEYSSATFNDNSTDTRTKTVSTDNSDNSTTNKTYSIDKSDNSSSTNTAAFDNSDSSTTNKTYSLDKSDNSTTTKTKSVSNANNNGDNRNNRGKAFASDYGAAANNNSTASTSVSDAWNSSSAVAMSKLEGSVSKIGVHGLGNSAWNVGSANGGNGGKGGGGDGGKAVGAKPYGATGAEFVEVPAARPVKR